MEASHKPLNRSQQSSNVVSGREAHASVQLVEKARSDTDTVLKELGSQLDGLSEADADSRLKQIGTNEIARDKRQSALARLANRGNERDATGRRRQHHQRIC